jgi:hypothetical protein
MADAATYYYFPGSAEQYQIELNTRKFKKDMNKRGNILRRQTQSSKKEIVKMGGRRFRLHVKESIIHRGAAGMKQRKRDLKSAGHPYASKHTQTSRAASYNTPWWEIHSSGRMLSRLDSTTKSVGWTSTYKIFFKTGGDFEYIEAVLNGSTKMIGRDILLEVGKEPTVRDDVFSEMERVAIKELSKGWGD